MRYTFVRALHIHGPKPQALLCVHGPRTPDPLTIECGNGNGGGDSGDGRWQRQRRPPAATAASTAGGAGLVRACASRTGTTSITQHDASVEWQHEQRQRQRRRRLRATAAQSSWRSSGRTGCRGLARPGLEPRPSPSHLLTQITSSSSCTLLLLTTNDEGLGPIGPIHKEGGGNH